MTVRVFSSARITLDEGTLDTFRTGGILNGAWTAVCVFKRSGSTGDGTQFMFSASSSGSLRFGLSYSTGSALQVTVGGLSRTFGASFTIANDTWYVFAVRKATGTATPSAKLWNAATGAVVADWTNGSGTLDDDTNLWDELQLGNRVNDFPLNGKMGGVALFSSDVGTTVGDTFGTGLQEWLDATPVGMWPLTQASTATPVADEVGDADQTAITGTSVDTGDDPAAFDLTLGGGGTTHSADTSLTATAALTAAAAVDRPGQGATTAAATVTSAAAVTRPAAAAVSVTAAQTAAAAVTRPASTSSSVAATLTSAAAVTRPAAASLTTTAGITADATVGVPPLEAQATLTAVAGRTAAAALTLPTAADVSPTATLTAATAVTRQLAAAVQSTATVTAAAARTMAAAATISAAATVTAAASVSGDVIVRPFTGTIIRPDTGIITRP
jgi:hypothetical protein